MGLFSRDVVVNDMEWKQWEIEICNNKQNGREKTIWSSKILKKSMWKVHGIEISD